MNALSLVLVITVLWDVEGEFSLLYSHISSRSPKAYAKAKPVNDLVVPG